MAIAEHCIDQAASVIHYETREGLYDQSWDRVNPSRRLKCRQAAARILNEVAQGLI
jgi:hypothetical protein